MMNDTVYISFNENVAKNIVELAEIPDEGAVQALADNILANMMILMTMLEPEDSGRIIGVILETSIKYSSIADLVLKEQDL